jgi:3-deoxy-manno-octulosonate cytidylyltransferase (CMP-KDO synthetase)
MPANKHKILGMIPARFASTRFPGKMLAPIAGKTLIQRTYENAKQSSLFHDLVVATDDSRIHEHVIHFGGKAVMTAETCPTGSDRLVDALKRYPVLNQSDIVINIQGDEPCVHLDVIEKIAKALISDPQAMMSTAAIPFQHAEEAESPSIVKCVIDLQGNALYFSRSLISNGHSGTWHDSLPVYRHMGIYAYRRDFLLKYADLPSTPLQRAEDLEQLKVLEHGFRIKVAIVEHPSIGVDLPGDIHKVEQWLCKQQQNISL